MCTCLKDAWFAKISMKFSSLSWIQVKFCGLSLSTQSNQNLASVYLHSEIEEEDLIPDFSLI